MKVDSPHVEVCVCVLVCVRSTSPSEVLCQKASTLQNTGAHYIVSGDYITVQECLQCLVKIKKFPLIYLCAT